MIAPFWRGLTARHPWIAQAKASLVFIRPSWRLVLAILFILLLIAALGAVEPVLYSNLFDRLWQREPLGEILAVVAALLILEGVREVMYRSSHWLSWKVRIELKTRMLHEVIGKITSLPLSYHARETVGGVIMKLDRGINGVVDALAEFVLSVVPGVGYLIFAVVIMLSLDWHLSLVVMVFAPLPALIGLFAAEEQTTREKNLLRRWEKIFARFNEVLAGIKTVKGFVMEESERGRFLGEAQQAHQVTMAGVGTDTRIEALKNIVTLTARIVSLGVGAFLVCRGEITAGTVLAFLSYQAGFFGPIHGLTGVYQIIRKASVSLGIIYSILDEKDELQSLSSADRGEMPRLRGKVVFDDVSFSYQEGREVLREISFQVEPGETVALVGPSGAGKTTLVSLLMRFYDPCRGKISIDGVDLRSFGREGLRRQIGIVLQDGLTFNDTVRNNICYGTCSASQEEIEAAARGANAHDFIMKLPDGYETVLGEGGGRLSGGEKQRLSIARVLLKNPPILILDEATSSLDAESEALIQETLRQLVRGRTTFIISHRLSTVTWADRILVVKEGRIIEHDTHQCLLQSGGYYSNLVQLQSRGLMGGPWGSASGVQQ